MLREPASSSQQFVPQPILFEDDAPIDDSPYDDVHAMRDLVEPYLAIAHEGHILVTELDTEDQAILMRENSDLLVTFSGYLKQDSELTYDALDEALKPLNRFPLLRESSSNPESPHIIHIVEGRFKAAKPSRVWINALLFVLTVFTVFFAGAQSGVVQAGLVNATTEISELEYVLLVMREIWRGYPFALSLLAILIAHEMGHYLVMRHNGVNASLPYFIPIWLISPFGTLGAAIVLRDVLKNRKTLLDVGAAGPIAGFIVAVPLVIYGLSTSEIVPLSAGQIEGNSLIYAFAKIVALGQFYPTAEFDVLINQVAFAGWTGLFVTALNMIPLGQLDGGHVMYALFGNKARLAFYPVMLSIIAMSFFTGQMTWVLLLVMLMLIGRFYAVPLDAITKLDPQRRVIAAIALIIFIVTFMPTPFYTLSNADISGVNAASIAPWMMMLIASMITLQGRWKRI